MPGSYLVVLLFINNFCLLLCNPITPISSETENATESYCPGGKDWCDDPDVYPEDEILEALTQENSQLLDLLDHQDHRRTSKGKY